MPLTNNVTRMLVSKGIPFEAHELPEEKLGGLEAAAILGVEPRRVFKTIVALRPEGGKPVLALVPAPDQLGPIVEVAVIPLRELRRLGQLKTLGEIRAVSHAVPKPSTKLDRAIAKKAARLEDARKLRAWALAVKTRDLFKCRKGTG